jgi:hypothetical protein
MLLAFPEKVVTPSLFKERHYTSAPNLGSSANPATTRVWPFLLRLSLASKSPAEARQRASETNEEVTEVRAIA